MNRKPIYWPFWAVVVVAILFLIGFALFVLWELSQMMG